MDNFAKSLLKFKNFSENLKTKSQNKIKLRQNNEIDKESDQIEWSQFSDERSSGRAGTANCDNTRSKIKIEVKYCPRKSIRSD